MKPAAMRPARMRPGVKNPGSRPRGSRRDINQRRKTPVYAVCLIGFTDLVPRSFSDQRGGYPVAIVTTKRPREAPKKYDYGQPYHRLTILEYTRVETEVHAKRLKAALDVALLGHAAKQNNDPARGLWRDVRGCFDPYDDESRRMWWIAMLVSAEIEVAKTIRNFRSYDARELHDDLMRGLG